MIQPKLRFPHPNPKAQLRLFCFPYAGGGASVYRDWSKHLPKHVEVCPVQLPGRENRIREAPHKRVDQLVATLAPALGPYLDKPFALFGHSMGAIISYELAQQLRRLGEPAPMQLLVSGRRAPNLSDPNPPLHTLPSEAFLDAVQKRYGGIPEIVLQDAEMRELFAPLLQADFTLVETYHCSDTTPLTCPIVAFGGSEDAHAGRDAMLAWRPFTRDAFTLHMFPGGHFYLNDQPEPLWQAISQVLPKINA